MKTRKQYARTVIPGGRIIERGRRFMVDVEWQGERPRPTFETHNEAAVWLAEQQVRMRKGLSLLRPNHQLERAGTGMSTVEQMLDHALATVWSTRGPDGGPIKSIKQTRIVVRQLQQALGAKTRLSKLTVMSIENGLRRLEDDRSNSPRTTNRRISHLLVALKEAERIGAIDKVPNLRKAPEVTIGRTFRVTAQLEQAMLSWALAKRGVDFYDFLVLSIYLGQRENETLRVRLKEAFSHPLDGYFDEADFAVFPASSSRNKSTLTRAIPLRPIVQEVVKRRSLSATSPDGRLLAGVTGDQVTHWFADLKAHLVADQHPDIVSQKRDGLPLGKDFCIHILRSEFCSRLGDEGFDVYEIARYSGHSDPRTCARYVKPNKVAHRKQLARMGRILPGLPGGEWPSIAPTAPTASTPLDSVPEMAAVDINSIAPDVAQKLVAALLAAGQGSLLKQLVTQLNDEH